MAEPDDIARQVENIYKGLLEKFHPSARQLVSAGKTYLKTLHSAAAAGRAYFEALHRVALLVQERGDQSAACDIGESLYQMSSFYRDMQAQELTALRAFYVDLLVPLESNIEKDVKQIQNEHKNFMCGHKQRKEVHAKAASNVKKNKKKGRSRSSGVDKQIKHYQALEESKGKLDAFLTQGLQTALQQERRRFGFVLERGCSLSRHHLALCSRGATLLQTNLSGWAAVAASRDAPLDGMGGGHCQELDMGEEEDAIYSTPSLEFCEFDNRVRRARSVDMNCLQDFDDGPSQRPVHRAVSDMNLDSPRSEDPTSAESTPRHRGSSASRSPGARPTTVALYKYTATAGTQLSFVEGDNIILIGEQADGWQYGENTKTNRKGWFPIAYTEDIGEDERSDSALGGLKMRGSSTGGTVSSWRSGTTASESSDNTITSMGTVRDARAPPQTKHTATGPSKTTPQSLSSPQKVSGGGDFHVTKSGNIFNIFKGSSFQNRYPSNSNSSTDTDYNSGNNSSSSPNKSSNDEDTVSDTSLSLSCSLPRLGSSSSNSTQRGRVSFHSSNDSGFSNDGSRPVQPTVDYSDADYFSNKGLDSTCDGEPQTYFPSRVPGRSISLGRCDDHLFHKRENSRCKDSQCDCYREDSKQIVLSPSAKRILAQRNNRSVHKKEKNSIKRSKSLLCLGINSCRGMPDDLISNDYEEMFSKDWYHRSLVEVSPAIPEPPKHTPPSPPCAECLTSTCSTSCTYCSTTDHDLNSSRDASTVPSRPIRKPCKPKKRPPMPLPAEAHSFDAPPPIPPPLNRPPEVQFRMSSSNASKKEGNIMTKSINRLSRSLTWASPSSKSKQNFEHPDAYQSHLTVRNNYLNSLKTDESAYSSKSINTIHEDPNTPPLPPRTSNMMKPSSIPARDPVNMFTYSEFIARRLRNPEGASLYEQQSASGNMCGKWYDLWDERTGCTEI